MKELDLRHWTLKKIMVAVLLIGLYSNIGWVVGSYYAHNVYPMKPGNLTFVGKVAAGGWAFAASGDIKEKANLGGVITGIIWPIMLLIFGFCWIVYGIYYGIYYVCWFLFAGGAVKLLGLV